MSKYHNDTEVTLEDGAFGDITFEILNAYGIKKINSNAFNKTKSELGFFYCWTCDLVNEQPKYDLQKMLNQLTQLKSLRLSLNIDEIPTNAIEPIDGRQSKIKYLYLESHKNLTIDSGAFQTLNQLTLLSLENSKINRIQNSAFKFNNESKELLDIYFTDCNFTTNSFQNGSFDGLQRPVHVLFQRSNISYLNESPFKSLLNRNVNNQIKFSYSLIGNHTLGIDCSDCRNIWLVKEKRQKQVLHAHCKHNSTQTLFDDEIQTKLTQKCK